MNRALKLALLAGAAVGAPAAANAIIAANARRPEEPFPGEPQVYATDTGRVHYVAKGSGKPLVLVHGIYTGASSYEWRSNVGVLAEHFLVYAPDLPGCGHSDKPSVGYTAETYVTFLEGFLRDVVREPACVVGSSISGAFAIAVARRVEVQRLALVAPTGLRRLAHPQASWQVLLEAALSLPVLGTSLYNASAGRASIRSYLANRVYLNPRRVTDDLVDHYYRVAHQPGADAAARAFMSGRLNLDVSREYPQVTCPILLMWGQRAQAAPLSDADEFLRLNGNARLRVFTLSGMLPQDEEAGAFNKALAEFAQADAASPSPSRRAAA